MAKLIKKSKCEFEAGIIVRDDEQVGLPFAVWAQLNRLELMLQQFRYLDDQPAYHKAPSLEGFERMSALESKRPYVDRPDTPNIDKRIEEAMAFMEECDKVNDASQINIAIDKFGALIDWCAADKFIEGDCFNVIDTPMLHNPLELTPQEIVEILSLMVESPIVIEA